ncbi:MAG: hypothetical protein AB7G68_11590 [Nitrospiraceae bacterium]
MIPATTTRVQQHTDETVNQAIRRRTEQSIHYYAGEGRALLDDRLVELEYEWDMERVLEANAAGASLIGVGLGRLAGRRWFILPGIVAVFLLQHAVQGWCPPVELFRRLGFRTASEIETERYALKIIRGDFHDVTWEEKPPSDQVAHILEMIERR